MNSKSEQSHLKDTSYVEQLSKLHNIEENLNTEVCKEILTHVESEIRLIIQDSMKFKHQFKHIQLTASDIDCALKDRGYEEKSFGLDQANSIEYCYERGSNQNCWTIKDKRLNLKKILENELEQLKKKPGKANTRMWWLQLDQAIPETVDNKFIRKKEEILKQTQQRIEEEEQDFNILKDKPLSLLTKELHEFYKTITETIAKEEILIDEPQMNNSYQESDDIQIIYQNLQKNTGISTLIPFLINYLYQDFDIININGILKKLITQQIIKSLIINPYINLEYYLHLIIKILLHFVTANKFQLNDQQSEQCIKLREDAAESLGMIVVKFSEKYFSLQQNISELLLDILRETNQVTDFDNDLENQSLLQNKNNNNNNNNNDYEQLKILQTEEETAFLENQQTIYGVLSFFFHMPVNIIKDLIFPYIQVILQNEAFFKCLNGSLPQQYLESKRKQMLENINMNDTKNNNITVKIEEELIKQQQQQQQQNNNNKSNGAMENEDEISDIKDNQIKKENLAKQQQQKQILLDEFDIQLQVRISQDSLILYSGIQRIIKKLFQNMSCLQFNNEQERNMFLQITQGFAQILEPISQNNASLQSMNDQPNYSLNALSNNL